MRKFARSSFGLRPCFVIWLSAFVISLSSSRADHLQDIQRRGVLLWGADDEGGAPYVYPNPDKPEQLIGFEYELADALAAKLGVKAKIVQNQWDQLVPALDRGNFDIILNGLEITADNQQHHSHGGDKSCSLLRFASADSFASIVALLH